MTFFKKSILFLLVMALFLVAGCDIINELREDGITGPSWDVNMAIPLLPNTEVEVGRMMSDALGDLLGEDGEELEFYDDAFIQEGFKLSDQFDMDDLDFEFSEVIDLDEDFDLAAVDDQIDSINQSLEFQETFDVGDMVESSFAQSIEVDTGEFDGIEFPDETFSQVVDFNFDDYDINIDEISQQIEVDGSVELAEGDIDYDFDTFNLSDSLSLDIPDEETDEIDSLFTGISESISLPAIPGEVTDEINTKLSIGPETIPFPEMSGENTISGDDHGILKLEFTEFEWIQFDHDSGALKVEINNQTGTDLTEVKVALINKGEVEPFTKDQNSIAEGTTGIFTLELAGNELKNEADIELTITPDVTTDLTGELGLEMYPDPLQEVTVRKVEVDDIININESENIPFYNDPADQVIKEIEFRSGNLKISVNTDPADLETEMDIDIAGKLDINIGGEVYNVGDNDLTGKTLDLTQNIEFSFSETTSTYISGAEIEVVFEFLNRDIRKIVLDDAHSAEINEQQTIDKPADLIVDTVTFDAGTLNITHTITEDGVDVSDELGLDIDNNLKLIIGDPADANYIFQPGDDLTGKTFDFTEDIQVIYEEDGITTFISNVEIGVEVSLDGVVIREAVLQESEAIEITETMTASLPALPENVVSAELIAGRFQINIDDGEMDNDFDIDIVLDGVPLDPVVEGGITEEDMIYDLSGQVIEGGEDMVITIDVTARKYIKDQIITYAVDMIENIDIGEIVLENVTHDHQDIISVDLPGDFQENIDQVTLGSGELQIEIDDGGLDLDYDLVIEIKGPGDVWQELDLISEIDGVSTYDLEGIEIEIPDVGDLELAMRSEISVNSFTYQEEPGDLQINGSLSGVDWESATISDFMIEDMDPFGDIDVEDVERITFGAGSSLIIELDFVPQPLDDYTLELNIKGLDETGTIAEVNPDADPDPHKVVIDLEGKTLELDDTMDITFNGVFIKGTNINADISMEITEIAPDPPITVEQIQDISFDEFPDGIEEINFAEGKLQVEINHQGLDIDIDQLLFDVGGTEYNFDYDDESSTDEKTVYTLDLTDITLDSNLLELRFKVVVKSYNAATAEDIEINVELIEDIVIGLIKLDKNEFSFKESINMSQEMDIDFLDSIKFNEALLKLEIADPVFETEIDVSLEIGEEELVIDQDRSNTDQGLYVYDFTDLVLKFEDEISFEVGIKSLTYKTAEERAGEEITVSVELENIAADDSPIWKEVIITGSALDEFDDFTLLDDEEQKIELGLGEFRDVFEGIRIKRDLFDINIHVDNNTPLTLNIEDLKLQSFLENEDQEDELLLEETINISISGGEEVNILEDNLGKLIDLVETFPDYITISGGNISIPDDQPTYTITPDTSVDVSGDYRIGLGFTLEDPDLDGKYEFKVPPMKVDIDAEQRKQIDDFLKEANLHYEVLNKISSKMDSFDMDIAIYLGIEEEGDNFEEDRDAFFDKADLIDRFELRAGDEAHKAVMEFKEEAIQYLTQENLYAGVKIIVYIDEDAGYHDIVLSVEDYIQIKMWSNVKVKVNPGKQLGGN